MTLFRFRSLVFVVVFLGSVAAAQAQEVSVAGTVTDSTGAVLPGVVIRATHAASGASVEVVTDARGGYRLPLRTGTYRIEATLAGFRPVSRIGLELLLGQQVTVDFELSPEALAETVTVTGEAPLVDVSQSRGTGNLDPRQVSELPVAGRNWLALTLLAPGSRTNAVISDEINARGTGNFQINVDGQQLTNTIQRGFGQPHFSRDAIAEFEFIANRFDATQGRSTTVQLNAVTKSGTNVFAGTLGGYFRHDRFNAADPVAKRVLPYSNQQVSTTFGGPIKRDRIHFFGYYEYEREPFTLTANSPFPRFNVDMTGTRREYKGGGRLDFQLSSATRLAVRGGVFEDDNPFDSRRYGGAARHPAGNTRDLRRSNDVFASLTHILGSQALNEVKGGYAGFGWRLFPHAKWPDSPAFGLGIGAPTIRLRGYTIGQNHSFSPQRLLQDAYSIRDDFSMVWNAAGRHTIKTGAEFLSSPTSIRFCNLCQGVIDAQGGPIPANIEDLFPVWNDVTTWNIAALSPITRFVQQNVGNFSMIIPRKTFAGWIQDDWAVSQRLTLNLGLRYDVTKGHFGEDVIVEPFLPTPRPVDKNNFAPRLGFAYQAADATVIRGGFGKYFAQVVDSWSHRTKSFSQQAAVETPNDGRPDFAANPYNGPLPTVDQIRNDPRARREITGLGILSPDVETPYSYQTSFGVARQLGTTMVVEADYVYLGMRKDINVQNINLAYDPTTGANYPFTDVRRRPLPDWGAVHFIFTELRSNSHAVQTAFRKRFSERWQASSTYLLSWLRDQDPLPRSGPGYQPVSFPVASDIGGEYGLADTDQRHRLTFDGIWIIGYGFQLSGVYFFGSGERYATTYGGDFRNSGGTLRSRLRPDGTIVPRNNFVGKPIHRVDVRLLRKFPLAGSLSIDGIVEVFNAFNHANFGTYTTQEVNRNYGQAGQNPNIAYAPRVLQLGFRLAF